MKEEKNLASSNYPNFIEGVSLDTGRKDDKGKARWDLLPFAEIEDIVDILTFGANKYAPNNWQKVDKPVSRYIAAAFRHFVAWCKGDKIDKESGKSHLAHAACNLIFLMWFEKNK